MTCRTGIILICGWLLFLPPGPGINHKAPLHEWQHVGSFDTASACDQERSARLKFMFGAGDYAKDPETKRTFEEAGTRLGSARCVPVALIDFKLK